VLKRRLTTLLFCSFLLVIPVQGRTRRGDFQIWNYYCMRQECLEKLDSSVEIEFRLRDEARHVYYYYVQGFLHWKPKEWLEVSPSYRQEWSRLGDRCHPFITLGVPTLDLTLRVEKKGWTVRDRNRFEYIIPYARHLPRRSLYRNRIQLEYPLSICNEYFTPFVSEEIFLRNFRKLVENRVRVGFFAQGAEVIRLQLFYQFRQHRGTYDHDLGMCLYLST
jgi:hypothetical protein